MTVRAEISEADIVRVRPGQQVYFTILGDPDHRYEATLAGIEPAPESIISDSSIVSSGSSGSAASSSASEAIYYIGTFDIANPDHRLRTYMPAEVQLVLQEARDVIAIPAAPLLGGGRAGGYRLQVVVAAGPVGSTEELRVGAEWG